MLSRNWAGLVYFIHLYFEQKIWYKITIQVEVCSASDSQVFVKMLIFSCELNSSWLCLYKQDFSVLDLLDAIWQQMCFFKAKLATVCNLKYQYGGLEY